MLEKDYLNLLREFGSLSPIFLVLRWYSTTFPKLINESFSSILSISWGKLSMESWWLLGNEYYLVVRIIIFYNSSGWSWFLKRKTRSFSTSLFIHKRQLSLNFWFTSNTWLCWFLRQRSRFCLSFLSFYSLLMVQFLIQIQVQEKILLKSPWWH